MAFRTIGEANSAAAAGDTIEVREGGYNEPISPARSGTAGAPITYRNFDRENVTITGTDQPAVQLLDKFYIIIKGIAFNEVLGWGRLENGGFNRIEDCRFANALARGTTGGLKLVRSHFNRIIGNTFETGNDSVVVQESDRNLVAGNKFRFARHSLLSVRCGNFNVIRENEFHNERQKAMEIYDCEAVSDAPYKLNATKRNLIENNRFIYTRGPSEPHKYNAIQFSGQYAIIRRNLFFNNQGGGVNFSIYSAEALHNYGNRVYNNTFVGNRCYGLYGARQMGRIFGDNVVANNVFFKNEDCRGVPEQICIGDSAAVALKSNLLLKPTQDPCFVSESDGDFSLRPGSPLVDAGTFLSRAAGGGEGTSLPVDDVRGFSDGFGIQGLQGDVIQLEGESRRARITGIDYVRGTLALDVALSWKNGQGIALAYEGKAPDVGAFEYHP